eukprot:gene2417-2881_t
MTDNKEKNYLESEKFGGNGGSNFEELSDKKIIGFNVKSGRFLNNIQPVFEGDIKGSTHGGGGKTKTFKLTKGEEFTKINIKSGSLIDAIQFETTKKKSEWFGGSGGGLSSFDIEGDLVGIRGSTGSYVDSLQFICFLGNISTQLTVLSDELKKSFNDKSHSDVKITVNDDTVFYLHKLILIQSPFFEKQFKTSNELSLKVESVPHFELLLEYLYTGVFVFEDSNYMQMLVLANDFQVEPLKLSGFEYIIKRKCNAKNVCKLLMDSKKGVFSKLDPDDLIKRCMVFIQENTEEVFKSPDFIHLDHEFILSMIKSDDLDIDEIDIFRAALTWGKHQKKTRKDEPMEKILEKILPQIRFVNMDGADLVHYVRPSKLIDSKLYLRILEAQTAPEDFDLEPLPEMKQRGGSKFKWDIKFPAGNNNDFKVDSKGLTIEKIGGGSQWTNAMVYGDKKLTKGIHYWEIKILNIQSDKSGTAIGLAESNVNKTQFSSDHTQGMSGSSYCMSGSDYTNGNNGDTVGIYVDFKKLKAYWFINGKKLSVHYDLKKGQSYYPVIHIYYLNNKFQLSFPKKPKLK